MAVLTVARVRVESRAHTRARLLRVTGCAVTPAGVMRGRDGAGERKAGARRKGVIRGLVFRTFSFPICVGFERRAEVGVAPWKEDRDARGGQSSSRGHDTPSSEGVGGEVHTRA